MNFATFDYSPSWLTISSNFPLESVNCKSYELPEHPFCLTPTRRYCGVGPSVNVFNRETAAGV